ncbi:MAG TPA: hypothetical protein VIF57_13950 [Polyangia bacterium]|jgi:phage shock protein A
MYRLWDLLAAHGLPVPHDREMLRELLIEAERAVSIVRADEKRLRSSAAEERALVDEWSAKARLARNIGEEDLAAQADARAAGHAGRAGELEREVTSQTAVLVKLEDQLAELRRSVG